MALVSRCTKMDSHLLPRKRALWNVIKEHFPLGVTLWHAFLTSQLKKNVMSLGALSHKESTEISNPKNTKLQKMHIVRAPHLRIHLLDGRVNFIVGGSLAASMNTINVLISNVFNYPYLPKMVNNWILHVCSPIHSRGPLPQCNSGCGPLRFVLNLTRCVTRTG